MMMIAMSVPLILVQEQLLMGFPNIQLTVLLIILFSTIFSYKESMIMVLVYVVLDSLVTGTMDLFYVFPLLIGWSIIPTVYNFVLKRTVNEYYLAGFALVFGFLYGWVFIPFRMVQFGVSIVWPYFVADLPFEIIMAVVGFSTVLLIFKPLYRALHSILNEEEIYEVNLSED
jgi:hypothetical protein